MRTTIMIGTGGYMTEEQEQDDVTYEGALDFFASIEGISKRTLNMIPRNTVVSIKNYIDNEFIHKSKMKEILKDFIKKEKVDTEYVKRSELEEIVKNNSSEVEQIKKDNQLEKNNVVNCVECKAVNYDFMYNSEREKINVLRCIQCGADLYPPKPLEIKKKYIVRPKGEYKNGNHIISRYKRKGGEKNG